MSFVDILRRARGSRASILHEFWTQFDPKKRRVHAFFEGHDDITFFVPRIERKLGKGYRLCTYRCDGKAQVFEAFESITSKLPNLSLILFFTDKDVDDFLATSHPSDPRIFVTDVYSIENYLVSKDVFLRFYRDTIRLPSVVMDEGKLAGLFEQQLSRFQQQLLTVMAWVVFVRRAGDRPTLNNVNLSKMWDLGRKGEIRAKPGKRMESLILATGISRRFGSLGRLREVRRELERVEAKRVLRGKFELWFLVKFWQRFVDGMILVAREAGETAKVKVQLTVDNAVSLTSLYVENPRSLELFLQAHLARTHEEAALEVGKPTVSWWRRLLARLEK